MVVLVFTSIEPTCDALELRIARRSELLKPSSPSVVDSDAVVDSMYVTGELDVILHACVYIVSEVVVVIPSCCKKVLFPMYWPLLLNDITPFEILAVMPELPSLSKKSLTVVFDVIVIMELILPSEYTVTY